MRAVEWTWAHMGAVDIGVGAVDIGVGAVDIGVGAVDIGVGGDGLWAWWE